MTRQIALVGVSDSFLALEHALLAENSPEAGGVKEVVKQLKTLSKAFLKPYPKEIFKLSEALYAHIPNESIALVAARAARSVGDLEKSYEFLRKVSCSKAQRLELESLWRLQDGWAKADARVQQGREFSDAFVEEDGLAAVFLRLRLMEEEAGDAASLPFSRNEAVLYGAVCIANREARDGFYQRALHRLNEATKLAQSPSPKAPFFNLLLEKLGLRRPVPEIPPSKLLINTLSRAEAAKSDLTDSIQWMKHGFHASTDVGERPFGPNRNILYLTFGSLPYRVNGNASRTHGLLSAITQAGWKVRGMTRPGFPNTLPSEGGGGVDVLPAVESWENSYRFDGVTYTNLRPPEAKQWALNLRKKFESLVEAAIATARRDHAGLIHGASNHLIGAAAVHAAERLNLPSVYELRGMWMLDFSARNPAFTNTEEYRWMERLEVDIANKASHVFSISCGIRDFLVSQGVDGRKITLLPNGVPIGKFVPGPPDPNLQAKLGLTGRNVIGFAGSFTDYEGVNLLISAIRLLCDRIRNGNFVVLLIGDGPVRKSILEQIRQLRLEEVVFWLPPVPFDSVPEYLKLIDIVAIPRPPYQICELVTPIKPFEAMALGKTVVVSSVGGLLEVVTDNVTGLVHGKGNVESLADRLEQALGDPSLRERLGAAAREHVLKNHDWNQIVRNNIVPVYERLTGSSRLPIL